MKKIDYKKWWKEIKAPPGWKGVIPFVLFAAGAAGLAKFGPDIHNLKFFYPPSIQSPVVIDGDTLEGKNLMAIRLIGVNAPEVRTKEGKEGKEVLEGLVKNKKVWLEYDRYGDELHIRTLVWAWIDCESTPKFLAWDYMKLSGNKSRPGLIDNPAGCKQGQFIQEELLKKGVVKMEVYKDRGELKYEGRIKPHS